MLRFRFDDARDHVVLFGTSKVTMSPFPDRSLGFLGDQQNGASLRYARCRFLLANHGGKSSLGHHPATRPPFGFLQFGEPRGKIRGAIKLGATDSGKRGDHSDVSLPFCVPFGVTARLRALRRQVHAGVALAGCG